MTVHNSKKGQQCQKQGHTFSPRVLRLHALHSTPTAIASRAISGGCLPVHWAHSTLMPSPLPNKWETFQFTCCGHCFLLPQHFSLPLLPLAPRRTPDCALASVLFGTFRCSTWKTTVTRSTKKRTDTMRSPTVTRTSVGLYHTHEADLQREHFIFGSKMWQFKQCFRKAAASLEMVADDVPAEGKG